VILFSVVRKIAASRENRGELLGDEVVKTASYPGLPDRNKKLLPNSLQEIEKLSKNSPNVWK